SARVGTAVSKNPGVCPRSIRCPHVGLNRRPTVHSLVPQTVSMRTEELRVTPEFRLMRAGRFLIAELLVPHRALTTSCGESELLEYIVNHQSCEGAGHR